MIFSDMGFFIQDDLLKNYKTVVFKAELLELVVAFDFWMGNALEVH